MRVGTLGPASEIRTTPIIRSSPTVGLRGADLTIS
jgi:hypothetical protein